MQENSSKTKAIILIRQIESQNPVHSHYLIMALNCLITQNPKMSVSELQKLIENSCPATKKTYEARINNQVIKIVIPDLDICKN